MLRPVNPFVAALYLSVHHGASRKFAEFLQGLHIDQGPSAREPSRGERGRILCMRVIEAPLGNGLDIADVTAFQGKAEMSVGVVHTDAVVERVEFVKTHGQVAIAELDADEMAVPDDRITFLVAHDRRGDTGVAS